MNEGIEDLSIVRTDVFIFLTVSAALMEQWPKEFARGTSIATGGNPARYLWNQNIIDQCLWNEGSRYIVTAEIIRLLL
jgi:hypothetical protein